MRSFLKNTVKYQRWQRTAGRATIGTAVGLVVGAGLGLAAGTLWLHRATNPGAGNPAPEATSETQTLSEGTKAILKRLEAPAEFRLYATLDPLTAPPELKAFTNRIDQLLSLYQQEAPGKIKIIRQASLAYTNAAAAAANGIKPLTLKNGEECMIGLVVNYKGHRETVPQLVPEWEAAMEIDISRAIQNAINSAPASSTPTTAARGGTFPVEELKRLIPNLESVTLEEGTRVLREASLKEFAEAAKESQAQLQEAQQRLVEAQKSGTEADQQAAVKALQDLQSAQSGRLRMIAAKSRAQIDALRAIKGSGQ